MPNQAGALYQLQQIDLEILAQEKRLQAIAEALTDREAITQAKAQVQVAQDALRPLRNQVRQLELDIQTNAEKSAETEERLYSGQVKNTKEMRDMQQEIQSLKSRKTALEDTLLELMMTVEEAEETLQSHENNLHTATAQWEAAHASLLKEQADLTAKSEKLQQKRAKALEPVEENSLQLYSSLRKAKANQPVSIFSGGSCSVCGIALTRAVEQAVRHGDLVQCTNCGRILIDKSF